MEFVKTLSCCVDHEGPCRGDVVPHHTDTGGVGMKGSDLSTIPLCDIPHNGVWHAINGGKETFERKYNVDVWRLVQSVNWAYIRYLEEKKS